jgi:hypothetical protein
MLPLCLFVLSPFLALAGLFLIRSFKLDEEFTAGKDFFNVISRVLGGIFGLFLAFCIISGWGRFLEARRIVHQEITCLSSLSRDSAPFPEDMLRRVHQALAAYCKSVAEEEWPLMVQESKASKVTEGHYEALWGLYTDFSPENDKQKIFYQSSVAKLNELSINRRLRLLHGHTPFITPLVAFLFFGCVSVIGVSYCFPIRSLRLQSVMIVALSILVCGGFYLAYELQDPFSGTIVVSPEGFLDLLASLAQRGGPRNPAR